MCFSPQRRAIFEHLNFKKCSETLNFLAFWLGNVLLATAVCNFSTSQLQKALWDPKLFSILTWKCASRHSGVQFLTETLNFLAFWLGNVLLATAVCNFSTSQLQKALWDPKLFSILTWKCASRHSGVQFLTETLNFLAFWLGNVLLATAVCNFSTSQLQKALWDPKLFSILTWKCASRHSGVQFLTETLNFLAFWLGNVLLATAVCNFSTSQLQKALWDPKLFSILTWKCASRHSGVQFLTETLNFLAFWLGNVLLATAVCNFSTSQLQKALWDPKLFSILTWKCASRHSGVQFLTETLNFLAFWLGNVLLATAVCNFSTSQLQKALWDPKLFSILTWKCASRHSGVQFLTETLNFLAFWLENVLLATAACNFWFLLWPHDSAPAALTSLLFDSPDTRIIEKTQHFATSNIWRGRIFFLLTFALLHLLSSDSTSSSDFTSSICFSSAFQLSILSEVYYLNFLRLIRTTNYCSVLWSITPYFIVHSTTNYYKVLLRTTMYYILLGPNKSYKILLRTTKYCCVLQTTTRYLSGVKNHWFLTCGARAEKSQKIASKHRVFLAFCLVKTLQIPVFLEGLLWELEVIKVKKTLVFTIHFKRLVTKTSQKTVFSTRSSNNTVNSGVLD